MNSWCALIAYVAGKRSQTLFLHLRPDCGCSLWNNSNKWLQLEMEDGGCFAAAATGGHSRLVSRPAALWPQPGSSSAPEIWSFLPDSRSSPKAGEALERSHYLGKNNPKTTQKKESGWWSATRRASASRKVSHFPPPHIWNFPFPRLNYNVINFVNNNYIFHYRIAHKGRRKTLSQDSPLSCLVSVCLFN